MPLISFSKIQALHLFEDNMALKNVITQSLRKDVRSASQGSSTASATSGGVMTRSMTKDAIVVTGEQSIVPVLLQSHKI